MARRTCGLRRLCGCWGSERFKFIKQLLYSVSSKNFKRFQKGFELLIFSFLLGAFVIFLMFTLESKNFSIIPLILIDFYFFYTFINGLITRKIGMRVGYLYWKNNPGFFIFTMLVHLFLGILFLLGVIGKLHSLRLV